MLASGVSIWFWYRRCPFALPLPHRALILRRERPGGCEEEGTALARVSARAHDLPAVVDGVGDLQLPAGVRGQETVQIRHAPVRPEEGVEDSSAGKHRVAHDLAGGVDSEGGAIAPAQGSQIDQAAGRVE